MNLINQYFSIENGDFLISLKKSVFRVKNILATLLNETFDIFFKACDNATLYTTRYARMLYYVVVVIFKCDKASSFVASVASVALLLLRIMKLAFTLRLNLSIFRHFQNWQNNFNRDFRLYLATQLHPNQFPSKYQKVHKSAQCCGNHFFKRNVFLTFTQPLLQYIVNHIFKTRNA